MSTDADRLVPGGRRKGLLRQLAGRHLPRAVINRPKMGFAIPIGQWFRTDFGGMRTADIMQEKTARVSTTVMGDAILQQLDKAVA